MQRYEDAITLPTAKIYHIIDGIYTQKKDTARRVPTFAGVKV